MTNITQEAELEKENDFKFPEGVQTVTIPVELYVKQKIELDRYACGRPLRMPADLTITEYNFLVKYLTDQRKLILNSDPKIPKPLKVVKNG